MSDVSGQVAIGEFINQFKIEKPSGQFMFAKEKILRRFLFLEKITRYMVEILIRFTPSAVICPLRLLVVFALNFQRQQSLIVLNLRFKTSSLELFFRKINIL